MPDAEVGAVTLHVPPEGNPVKLNDAAFEHTVDTGVIEGVAGLTMVRLVVPTLEQEGADNGVTVTEYCMEEEILAVGFETLVLLNPVAGDQLYEKEDNGGVDEQLPKRTLGRLVDVVGKPALPHIGVVSE